MATNFHINQGIECENILRDGISLKVRVRVIKILIFETESELEIESDRVHKMCGCGWMCAIVSVLASVLEMNIMRMRDRRR